MKKYIDKYFELIRRFTSEEVVEAAVGLDIGSHSCKALELIKKGNDYQVTNWAIRYGKEDVSDIISKLFEELSLETKSPYSAVSGKGTLIRYIDMPKMGLADLKRSFALEADKYFPFDQATIFTDCYILDTNDSDKKMSTLVAAVKKEMIEERMKMFEKLGFQSNFVGLNAVANANAFYTFSEDLGDDKSSAQAILDIGDSVSNLMIVNQKLPRFTRDIYIGSKDFTSQIANVLGLNEKEADEIKRNPGDSIEQIRRVCESTIVNLISEVRLSLDYFITEKNVQVDKLYLTGGGSLLEGIEKAFLNNLDVEIKHWNPFDYVSLAEGVDEQEFKENSQRLITALGLALYHYA